MDTTCTSFPPDGHLETSSHPETGWATDEFLDQRADGTRTPLAVTTWGGGGRIWARQTLTISDHRTGEDEERTHMFFVGTEDQYECYLEAVGMKPARKVDWPLGAPIGPAPEHCK